MIKIFTTEKVKELDQYTIQHEPILSIDLVERAATAFVHEFIRRYSRQKRVVVFAGQGNNGADALAIARLLKDESYNVVTYLFNPTNQLSPECEENRQQLREMIKDDSFHDVTTQFKAPDLSHHDVVIDGLFGSGLNRPLSGGFAAVVDHINDSDASVVAIDIPSGLMGEDNRENNPEAIIRAELTLSFGFPKLAFLFPENAPYVGEWKILDIGIHPAIIERTPSPYRLITEEDISMVLALRDKFAHKGIFGHALMIAGSRGKMGASVLASKACLRSGAGLVTAHIPQCGEQILQTSFPEAMVSLDTHHEYITSLPNLTAYSAIGVGPGLGKQPDTAEVLQQLFSGTDARMVIDADAINLIAMDDNLLKAIPRRSILTPHPKEFDRLAGESNCGYERLMKAQEFAKKHEFFIILKGAHTAICTPNGNIYFNNSGNPGMATAGSGDVLTGILTGLLAQGYKPDTAAALGVFIHSTAGDLAVTTNPHCSEESLIAGDIIEMLGKAFKQAK
ncbi:hydroxyethylthiazole kinase-like uncharacterized protein yjeF [Parabacteroides sp. PF5-5]|uniref:NAD(P)H-hydrate dehydratase n=1 Tax=unclassified Parabacteroides TaxID=2649774 RepID=UPI002476E3B5|nr:MULTISPECIES: NAD(P)H-hydrate dehydratase [unclassified Parabacteroides]MDH6305312.1 hydroxyethylthiazole kinase-like uncharacterized protein yjeF [Parabacteroides sp. PH5-39]MDH6316665.1 hydroxyethylthiazole kinase-like uncharacterized protein yjeF [Parabacteroides sp. PF5-13]MDH6320155.1 hydroxyethylthiazole kinase-like uncharacterized protein yjeF [Parabacteroides sp. PH5-13]MDH6323902.1 hydroxyethylthiazole kinase-like uncharacterized protein yjeF [Parabacteroides sp. PH5-8]MDH6327832.1